MNLIRKSARVFLAASVMAAGLASAQEVGLKTWAAPPYWMPGAAESSAVPAARTKEMWGPEERTALVTATPLPFVGITPCRQYDSRPPNTPLLQNTPRTVTLTGLPCGIPAAAQAVAVNITVFNITGAIANGVFSVGTTSPPVTSWINYPPTETQRANAGVVGLTVTGDIIVQVNQAVGSVDFLVDVYGYYAPGAPGSGSGILSSVGNRAITVDPFVPPSGFTFSPPGGTEFDNSVIAPATCLANFRMRVDVAPGGSSANSILFTLRVNQIDTSVSCTLATSATSCFSPTSAPITAGDLVSLHVTPNGANTWGLASFYWVSLTCQ